MAAIIITVITIIWEQQWIWYVFYGNDDDRHNLLFFAGFAKKRVLKTFVYIDSFSVF